MRAVRFHDYNGLSSIRVEDAPEPSVRPDEVLIRVQAAGVNPFDWYSVEGYVNQYVQFQLPAILGRDVSGVVEGVGTEVNGFAIGDSVFGQADPAAGGTFAELTSIAAFRLARKPPGLSHTDAAALPNVMLAAWSGLFSKETGADLQPGQRILINGAAGGIGHIAVQLAKWRGAQSLGTASHQNLAFLRDLGAVDAFDYAQPNWEASVGPIDAVLDTTDGQAAALLCGLIRPGGRYVSLRGPAAPAFAAAQAQAGIRCLAANGPDSLTDFAAMSELVGQGLVKPAVSGLYPMTEVKEALKLVQQGHVRGKLVLTANWDNP